MSRLNKVIGELQKKYGPGVVTKANEIPEWKVFPTGIAKLDYDLGGGLIIGQSTMIAGITNCGKTALATLIAANLQKTGIPIYYFDIDRKFDVNRSRVFGFDPDNAVIIRGELTAENIFGMVRDTIRTVKQDKEDTRACFIVDSIAAMQSEKMFEKSASEQYAGSSVVINQSMQIWKLLLDYNQLLITINEFRDNLTPMGEKEMMPGGQAQKFASSNIIWLRAGETLKDNESNVIGQVTKWTVKKTKTAAPKETGQVNFIYETGFDLESSMIEAAIEMGIIEERGRGIYVLPDGNTIRGKEKFISILRENTELLKKLREQVYSKMPRNIWNGELNSKDEKTG